VDPAVSPGAGPFVQVERFVAEHQPCGRLAPQVGEPTEDGYAVALRCSCGAGLENWGTSEQADHDLVWSTISVFPN
jgi:hypothetical protein